MCVRACCLVVLLFCEAEMQRGGGAPSDKLIRIAIVNDDKCKPKKCSQECKKSCPVVRMGMEIHNFLMFIISIRWDIISH